MSIQWGSWSSNNRLRCGIEVSQSPSTVGETTTSVKITVKVYLQTRYASWEQPYNQNNWYISDDITASGQTDWNLPAMGYKLMGTATKTVTTSTSSSVTTTVHGYIISREAYSGTRATSPTVNWVTAKRPVPPPPPPPDQPPTTPPPPPPPGEGGWCLYTHTHVPDTTNGLTLSCQWQPNALPNDTKECLLVSWGKWSLRVNSNGGIKAFGRDNVAPTGTLLPGQSHRISAAMNPAGGIDVVVDDQSWHSTATPVADLTDDDKFCVGGYADYNFDYTLAATGSFSHVGAWERQLSVTEMLRFFSDDLCKPGLKADFRMNTLLDYVGWPADKRQIDAALDTLNRESWSDNTSVMSLLQKWAKDDGGIVYADADGNIVFKNRHSRINAAVDFTLDFNGPTAPEAGLSFIMDEADITNVVNLNVLYGIKAAIRDDTSIAQYDERPQDLELDIQNSNVGLDAAKSLLEHYAQPIIRVDGLQIYPSGGDNSSLWSMAMTAEIGSVVEFTNMPATAPAATMMFFIESINHKVERDGDRLRWYVQFSISPYFADDGWVLDTSALDSTTKLAY